MDSLDAVVARNPGKIIKAANYNEVSKAVQQHKIAAMFSAAAGIILQI
jgi:membrane dipeptidase